MNGCTTKSPVVAPAAVPVAAPAVPVPLPQLPLLY